MFLDLERHSPAAKLCQSLPWLTRNVSGLFFISPKKKNNEALKLFKCVSVSLEADRGRCVNT